MYLKRLLGVVAVSVLFASPLSAQQAPPQGSPTQIPAQSLTLHGRDEPATLDPGLINEIPAANIAVNLFEGLLRYNPKNLEPEAGIAKSWTISEDGKVYTFILRSGVKWSDGSPLTAEDFAYAWERALRPATASQMAYQLYPIKNAEEYNNGKLKDPKLLGIRVLNLQTLQVTLNNPTPYFLRLMPFSVFSAVKKEAVEKFGDQWTRPEHIISNGPFVLKSWIPQKEIVLEKDPNYWDAKNVKLERVRYVPVNDYDTAFKMYESNQLDSVFEVNPVKVAQLKSRPDFIGTPYLASVYYQLNFERPPMNDLKVRQALALAIDRQALTDKVLRRGDIPLGVLIPPGIPGYPSPKGIKTDVEKAKQLLAEAGYGPGGKPFPTLEMLFHNNAEHKTVAETVQNMWKTNLGINATLRVEEWKVYLKSMESRNFQIVRAGWVGDYLDPSTFLELFTSNSQQNHGHYNSPEYDKLMEESRHEQNNTLRFRILKKAEEKLMEDVPLIPLYTISKDGLLKPYVKGYYPNLQDVHPLYKAYVQH